MKKLVLFGCFLSAASGLFAQDHTAVAKMDGQLKLWVTDPAAPHNAMKDQLPQNAGIAVAVIPVIFSTSSADPAALVARYGGSLHSVIGPICTADFPVNKLAAFASEPEVLKIESAKDMQLYNDKGRQLTGADRVNAGQLPSGQAFTGKGVIVGIIDTGLDFLHPDFRDKNDTTKSRVIAMWDQTATSGVLPVNYPYGAEWTKQELQDALTNPSLISQIDDFGHGTHVTGTSAGLRGIAYDADIVVVKTPLVGNGDYKFTNSAKTLDAVKYIYDQAVSNDKPCVINMSLGFNFGAPHDGTSLFEQGIDFLVNNRNGFIVCASAGNEGSSFSHHGGYNLTSDSVWTYVNTLNGSTWYAVADSKYDDSIYVAVYMDSAMVSFTGGGISKQKTIFHTQWFKLKDIKNSGTGFYYDIVDADGDTTATLKLTAAAYDANRTELYVYPRDKFVLSTATSPTRCNLYRIAFKGKGSFHAWSQGLNGFSLDVSGFNGKTDARFKASNNNYTIGIPATGNKVLAVGAYVNKKNYVDIKGRTQAGLNTSGASPGFLAYFSSVGPTLDGRKKPEFSAPGVNVASSLSRHASRDSSEMVDKYTAVFSGTSMSCPMAVGCVALYLEQNPKTTFDAIRAALDSNTVRDAFVKIKGATPNNYWGYGKLDIFKAMGSPWHAGTKGIDMDENGIVYPNPSSSTVNFMLPSNYQWQDIAVYDLNGKLVTRTSADHIDVSSWHKGIYIYRIEGSKQAMAGKFIVE